MLPNLELLFKVGRGNDVFKCFVTCESVYLSFLALQGKEQSFGFQDIAINVKLLTKYVTPDTLSKKGLLGMLLLGMLHQKSFTFEPTIWKYVSNSQ